MRMAPVLRSPQKTICFKVHLILALKVTQKWTLTDILKYVCLLEMLKYVLVLNICRRCLMEPAVNLLLSHYIQSIRDDLLRAPLHFGTESKWPKNEPHIGTQSVHQQVNKWPKNEWLTHKYCERCPSIRSGNICRRWAWLLWWNFQSILNINFHKKGQCHIIFRASAMETTRKDIITLFSEHQRWKCGSNCIQKVFWGAQVQASPSTPSSPLPRVLIVCTLFRQKTLWRWKITFYVNQCSYIFHHLAKIVP